MREDQVEVGVKVDIIGPPSYAGNKGTICAPLAYGNSVCVEYVGAPKGCTITKHHITHDKIPQEFEGKRFMHFNLGDLVVTACLRSQGKSNA